MMISQAAIKKYKTPIEKDGSYRMYFVYPQKGLFIFECWDCAVTDGDKSGVGTRKAYTEFSDVEDAIKEYETYIDTWESDYRK